MSFVIYHIELCIVPVLFCFVCTSQPVVEIACKIDPKFSSGENLPKKNGQPNLAYEPVESMLCTAGLVANSKRSSILAEDLHRFCSVHDNHKFSFAHKL